MPKMKALKRFPYFGRGLAIGEAFEASESDARVFELIGHAERDGNVAEAIAVPAQPQPKAQDYQTRDMAAVGRRGAKRSAQ